MRLRTLSAATLAAYLLLASQVYAVCSSPVQVPEPRPAPNVYAEMPFKKGEVMKLNVSYLKMNAGFLEFRVLDPAFLNDQWLMGFSSLVITGDWYEKIFKAHDEGIGYAYPATFAPHQFRMTQDHTPLIGKRYIEDKMIRFNIKTCDINEDYRDEKYQVKKTVKASLDPDAIDILSALYHLRTIDFTKTNEARLKVYTSEKNWWLTATREDFVRLTVPLGKFEAVRLKLQTYIGKELQQKGKVSLWIGIQKPRPILKVEAEIKIGSFVALLAQMEEGKESLVVPETKKEEKKAPAKKNKGK